MTKQKWWTVAAHEFAVHGQRKGFIAATVGMPLMFAAIFGLIILFVARGETPKGLAYIDQSGLTASQPDRVVITDTLVPDVPILRYDDEARARADTEAETIDGYVVIPADYLQTGKLKAVALDSIPDVSEDAFETFMRRALIAGAPSADAHRLEDIVTEIYSRTPDGTREATQGQGLILFFAPYLFSIFFFVGIFSSASALMTALVEEKENRVMEILATSIRPFSLMAGKIVGLGLLGLLQIGIWSAVVIGGFLIARSRFADMAKLDLPVNVLVTAVVLFVPAYLLVAACLTTIGSAVAAVQEGQQLSGIVSLLMISPVWFMPAILEHPNGALAVAASIFPFTAPVVMVQRVAIVDVPLWQVLLSLVLLIASAIGMMWVAGRVMRFGMLRYGKRLSFRELRQALGGKTAVEQE